MMSEWDGKPVDAANDGLYALMRHNDDRVCCAMWQAERQEWLLPLARHAMRPRNIAAQFSQALRLLYPDEATTLHADARLLALAWRGLTPDRNTQTEAEVRATEEAVEAAYRRVMGGGVAA